MDWDRSDDKSIGESDYRHVHDSVSEIFYINLKYLIGFNVKIGSRNDLP